MNRIIAFSFLAFLALAMPNAGAYAQQNSASQPVEQQQAPSDQTPEQAVEIPLSGKADEPVLNKDATATGDSEITVMKDNFATSEYVNASMENLAKLYWRLGVFKLSDKTAIDNYLIINECDVYRNFFRDDFEWSNVRKATQDMLQKKAGDFTNKFKVLVPIDLGRYDMQRGGFSLTNDTAFINSRRVQVTGNSLYFTGCEQKGDLKGYPSRVVLILNKPFTFNFIKVDEHVAQAFLLRKKYNSTPLPRELRNKGFQRPAYARMRVTFVRHQGTMDEQGGRKLAILYGTLDGIDVFEDLREEMLLTSISYK